MRKILYGLAVCLAVLSFTLGCLAVCRVRMFIVMSGSMEPSISTGSLIIADTTKKEPAAGEVVTYSMGETRVTHRVIRLEQDGSLITKGDANPSEDPAPVKLDQIEGTVLFAVPKAGSMIISLRSPSAVCFLFLLSIILTFKRRKHT